MFEARNPSGRFGKAEEVAMLAVYLASDEVSIVGYAEFYSKSLQLFCVPRVYCKEL